MGKNNGTKILFSEILLALSVSELVLKCHAQFLGLGGDGEGSKVLVLELHVSMVTRPIRIEFKFKLDLNLRSLIRSHNNALE